MVTPSREEMQAALQQLRLNMSHLMRQIQELTEQQIFVMGRFESEEELEDDPEFQELVKEKATLSDLYAALTQRAEEMIQSLDDA